MKIAIIGSGNVGAALAKAWARAGHEIKMGVRDVSSPKVTDLLKDIGSGATAASVRDAADFGEIIVLATPWSAVQDAVKSLGDISGKVLFDCTNPFKPQLAGLEWDWTTRAENLFRLGRQTPRLSKYSAPSERDDGGCLFRTGQAGDDLLRQRPSGEADGRNTRH
ncbi:MAG: NAD(P)-binding domain-containing protein [Acidobacteria bacterium]|nr:NAD(P)-binding domain-containing protein [Acidobacteriota bacterium]